jgi:hypothetical protein
MIAKNPTNLLRMKDIFGPSIFGGVYNTVKMVRRVVQKCYEEHQ